ncbi:hypothetical protein BGZ57DRAFT_972071 [Hyaloscypha finlandica]|nr:hypothetical protein BGZ57DRAFT_972071 [Hyaloscypha finlandica]
MPGGRPRKYVDKAAAKAADMLRAIERKAAKKAARERHGTGVRDGGYRFILEDILSPNTSDRVNGRLFASHPRPPASQSPSPVKDPSPSLPPPSPSSPDVNGPDISGLDAFGKLILDSTNEDVSHGACLDVDGLESESPIKNTDNLDYDVSDDYSAQLSDVFIDFGGDFDDGIHSTTGEVDDRGADIENVNHLHKVRNHRYTNSDYGSINDLQQLVDPTLPHSSYIPDVLSRNDIKIADRYTCFQSRPADPLILSDERMQDGRFQKLFEGRGSDSTQPQNVCLHLHTSSRLGRPPTRAVDFDSAYSEEEIWYDEIWMPALIQTIPVTNFKRSLHYGMLQQLGAGQRV